MKIENVLPRVGDAREDLEEFVVTCQCGTTNSGFLAEEDKAPVGPTLLCHCFGCGDNLWGFY